MSWAGTSSGCPRCSGFVIVDRRPGAFEPECLNCGWCWISERRLKLSRAWYRFDSRFVRHAEPMHFESVERMYEKHRRAEAAARARKRAA